MPFVGDTTPPTTPTTWSFSNPPFPITQSLKTHLTCGRSSDWVFRLFASVAHTTFLHLPPLTPAPVREHWAPPRLQNTPCAFTVFVSWPSVHTRDSPMSISQPLPGSLSLSLEDSVLQRVLLSSDPSGLFAADHLVAGVSNPWSLGHMWPRMAVNVAPTQNRTFTETLCLLISFR